jgi:hypothetical protein
MVVGRVVEVSLDPSGGSAEAVECPNANGVNRTRVPVIEMI